MDKRITNRVQLANEMFEHNHATDELKAMIIEGLEDDEMKELVKKFNDDNPEYAEEDLVIVPKKLLESMMTWMTILNDLAKELYETWAHADDLLPADQKMPDKD